MKKKAYAVQFMFEFPDNSKGGMFIEQLRYAGRIEVVSEKENDEHTGVWFVLRLNPAPNMTEQANRVWAKQNADRMASFGINAKVVNL